jgi:hypothetical protein
MNKTSLFSSKKQAVDYAAGVVAYSWLKSAENILARGEKPAPFSGDNGVQLCRSEIDRVIYNRFRRFISSSWLAMMARQEIKNRLAAGRCPAVLAHFSAGAAETAQPLPESAPMITVPPMPVVTIHQRLDRALAEIDRAINAMDGGLACNGPAWAAAHACRQSICTAMQLCREGREAI